jgi:(p)ppGpp synthase/HD superfamily hydrolase
MERTMSDLEHAISLAAKTHSGQVDKAGEPYILHPLRVMFRLSSDDERIVAVLHDVVEDSELSLEDLRDNGFSEEVVRAIEAVTKLPEEEGSDVGYQAFVERAGNNPIACKVKIADLQDNLEVTRLSSFSDKDARRVARYLKSLRYLEKLAN